MSLVNIFAKTTSALSSVLGSALYVVIFGGLLAGLVAQLQITPVVGTQQVAVVLPFAVVGMLLVAWLSEKFLPLLTLPYNDWIYCGRVRRFRMIVRWPMLAQLVVLGIVAGTLPLLLGYASLVHVVVYIVAVMGAAWHMKKPRRVENFGMDDMGVGVLIPTGLLLYAWGRYWPLLVGMLAVAFL